MPQGVAGASAGSAPFAKQVPCAFAVGRPALLGDGFRRERVTLLSAGLTGHSPPRWRTWHGWRKIATGLEGDSSWA